MILRYLVLCCALMCLSCSPRSVQIPSIPEDALRYAQEHVDFKLMRYKQNRYYYSGWFDWCGRSRIDSVRLAYPCFILSVDYLKYETGMDPLECIIEESLQNPIVEFAVQCADYTIGFFDVQVFDSATVIVGEAIEIPDPESYSFDPWMKYSMSEGYIIFKSRFRNEYFIIKDGNTIAIYSEFKDRYYDSFNEIDLYMLQRRNVTNRMIKFYKVMEERKKK